MIDEILKIVEKIDKRDAITIKEISEILNEKEKKIAGILKRMRKNGIIAFEKKEIKMKVKIIYTNKDLVAERFHKANPYFYWGILQ